LICGRGFWQLAIEEMKLAAMIPDIGVFGGVALGRFKIFDGGLSVTWKKD